MNIARIRPDTAEIPTAAPAPGPEGSPFAAEAIYRGWGWPVTLRQGQVWLELEPEAVALIVPVALAAGVAAVLTGRHCSPAMLVHPYVPEHRVLLAGEPFPVALPWPPGVHRVTSCLLLPPTMTPRGPLTWAIPPQPNALALCREIDVLAALRAEPPLYRTRSAEVGNHRRCVTPVPSALGNLRRTGSAGATWSSSC